MDDQKLNRDNYILPEDSDDDYLDYCVVDVSKRSFYMVSSSGDEKYLQVEEGESFIELLNFVRAILDDSEIRYAEPLTK
jgi:hypothetical protein|tara:strand:+ start:174 stop:410 length:237 start_codon:yes stop_codon:yes gene_type:complete